MQVLIPGRLNGPDGFSRASLPSAPVAAVDYVGAAESRVGGPCLLAQKKIKFIQKKPLVWRRSMTSPGVRNQAREAAHGKDGDVAAPSGRPGRMQVFSRPVRRFVAGTARQQSETHESSSITRAGYTRVRALAYTSLSARRFSGSGVAVADQAGEACRAYQPDLVAPGSHPVPAAW